MPSSGTHEALTQAVRSGGDSFKDVRLALFDLRKAREKADYVLSSQELSAADVRKLIVIARWLIRNRLKALPEAEFRRLRVPRA